jgi:hypothetical protein
MTTKKNPLSLKTTQFKNAKLFNKWRETEEEKEQPETIVVEFLFLVFNPLDSAKGEYASVRFYFFAKETLFLLLLFGCS